MDFFHVGHKSPCIIAVLFAGVASGPPSIRGPAGGRPTTTTTHFRFRHGRYSDATGEPLLL